MQEHAFGLLTIMMYSKRENLRDAVRSKGKLVLERIMSYIENATYKCERASGENASECLSLLVGFDEVATAIRQDTATLRRIA
jgi:hypothetical protein